MSESQASAGLLYVGLMSGASLDGVDAVLADLGRSPLIMASQWLPYPQDIKSELLALHEPGHNELDRAARLSNRIAGHYADAVRALLDQAGIGAARVRAIGCHGQTIRHQPASGISLQLNNPALLAELTGIPVVADFRSRDIAAGGQGGPLVSAFHSALFRSKDVHRVLVNIGGIATLTDLPPNGPVTGFDCGPGNMFLDVWVKRHWGCDFDPGGGLSAQGRPIEKMLQNLQAHPYFSLRPPKCVGRETFTQPWLNSLVPVTAQPEDVLATLLEFTVRSIANCVRGYCLGAREVWLCGGGAHNDELFRRLAIHLPAQKLGVTDALGVHVDWVEALSMAWLARQSLAGRAGNLPQVTGARGPRVLGAIYPG